MAGEDWEETDPLDPGDPAPGVPPPADHAGPEDEPRALRGAADEDAMFSPRFSFDAASAGIGDDAFSYLDADELAAPLTAPTPLVNEGGPLAGGFISAATDEVEDFGTGDGFGAEMGFDAPGPLISLEPLLSAPAPPPEPPPPPPDPREALFQRLLEDPYSFDFYQAVRRLECTHPDVPPVGQSIRPAQDVVRFCQEPSLSFAPSNVWRYEPANPDTASPARLFTNFLGLLGPNGPMPLHLTDYARDREQNHGDAAMARFFDLFNHRMVSLFYRAWSASNQAISFERGHRQGASGGFRDRTERDRFAVYIASLFGIGSPALRNRDAVDDVAKLHYSGRLSCQTRNAEGLRAIVQDFFGVDAEIEQFIGRWIDIPVEYRCRLGETTQTGLLGSTAIVGSRMWDCQQKFRIRLGPMTLKDYQRLLPGGNSLKRLVAWVKNYTGDEFEWDVQLVLKRTEVPQVQLGKIGRLGWTTWLQSEAPKKDQDDLVLQPCAA